MAVTFSLAKKDLEKSRSNSTALPMVKCGIYQPVWISAFPILWVELHLETTLTSPFFHQGNRFLAIAAGSKPRWGACDTGDFGSGVTFEWNIFEGKTQEHRLEMRIRPSFEKGFDTLKHPWGSFPDTASDVVFEVFNGELTIISWLWCCITYEDRLETKRGARFFTLSFDIFVWSRATKMGRESRMFSGIAEVQGWSLVGAWYCMAVDNWERLVALLRWHGG
jgi:hypothetical protein